MITLNIIHQMDRIMYFVCSLLGSTCTQDPALRHEMEMEEEVASSYGRGPRRGKKKVPKGWEAGIPQSQTL